jgi:hydroxymethylbilane synthase
LGPIRLATRGSAQAFTQAELVAAELRQAGFEVELVVVETHGDRTQAANIPLHTIGGQGVFAKEVQTAVLDGRADIAVHSAKDLPSGMHDGLVIGAFTKRRSPEDALVGSTLEKLPAGASVATGSVRRRAQLESVRPDLEFRELRGNIHSRLEKVPDGGAIVIAVAALEILKLTDRIAEVLNPAQFVPAVGQGCVAIECREGDDSVIEALKAIDDSTTRHAVSVEREFLGQLGSGCSLPVGAYATANSLRTFLADVDSGVISTELIDLCGIAAIDRARARTAARVAYRAVSDR